ncbi:MAG: type II secretion system secretin GspD [Deltaproteobacteria bacterium]|nr:type II secretion system secretin GspD [Deltaproteobacteria bacterium]
MAFSQSRRAPTKGSVKLPEKIDTRTVPIEEGGRPTPEGPPVGGKPGEELVYLNVQEQDIKDVIRQISKATGKNFIIDDKIRGKVTILSERKMTKEEAYQAFLSALEVANYTTVTGPGGIIKVVPLKEAISSPIPIYVDSTPHTDSYVTRLISLENISALDMSNAIKDLISKSGNMFAYPATNTLVITDSGTNIDRLMKIIKELDQEGPQQVLEIIPVNYADAADVAAKVLNLFEIQQAKTTTSRSRRSSKASSQLTEIKELSKIIADDRTNSLIVYASKRAIGRVREVIAKLDVPLDMADTGNIHVHYLKYANAVELAETLSSVTSGAAAKSTKGKKGAAAKKGSSVASIGEDVKIGADDVTNALIITASAKDYSRLVDELISKLDVPRRQVFLEAIVMELSVTKDATYGATGYGGYGAGSVLGFGSSGFGDSFNPATFFTPGGAGLFGTPGLLGGLLSRDTITLEMPSEGGGTQELTIPAFAAFLNFLQSKTVGNIVSTPNILTLDNQKASIDVSKTIYVNKVSQSGTTGFQTTEPTPLEAGLTLEITPQITEGDAVRMEIHHKLSNFLPTSSTGSEVRDSTKREINTTVVAMNGQTVVLGGLMEDTESTSKQKIPILGDIPILGWLFSKKTKGYNKSNLLVFITPYVIREPADFAEITKTKINQRNQFMSKNFSRRQQRNIRETLAAHRADLLEGSDEGEAPLINKQGVSLSTGGTGMPVSSSTNQPVITVPPVGNRSVSGTPPLASSKSQPVYPSLPPPPSSGGGAAVSPGTPRVNQQNTPDMGY